MTLAVETAPAAVGFAPDLPDRLREIVAAQIDAGLAYGMQLVVARHGLVVIDDVIGTCAGGDEPIDHDTRFHLASASKAITATAVHMLADRGLLTYNDPVARHLEEFAAEGKADVTLRQVMSHQAGFPDLGVTAAPAILSGEWEAAVAAVCALPLEYAPGEKVVYHALTASTVLAEVVSRVDGRSFPAFCREEIFDPLGMKNTAWGLPDGVAATEVVGWDDAMEAELAPWKTETARQSVVPGANAHGTARDLAALYLGLSGGTDTPLVSPATMAHATALHAPMIPGLTWGFGLGYMVGTDPRVLLSRGSLGSLGAFGHPGHCFTQALCDPRDDVVMVFLANVAPSQSESDRRFSILCDTVYRAVSTT